MYVPNRSKAILTTDVPEADANADRDYRPATDD